MTERWDHFMPGSFNWCVDRVDLGDPVVSRIVRVICRDQTVWPEQMLGRRGAPGAFNKSSYPLETGPCYEPCREPRFVFARRLAWRASYELTDWSIENIAELIGGYRPTTVRPWALIWEPFSRSDPEWWWYWGPKFIDLLGCEMPAEYVERVGRPYEFPMVSA